MKGVQHSQPRTFLKISLANLGLPEQMLLPSLQQNFQTIKIKCTFGYARNSNCIKINTKFNYSVTNSTGGTQPFSANHKTSSEQKNRSSFISDQSQIRDLRQKVVHFCQQIYLTKMDETHEHLPSDGLTEDKTDLTRICLTFTLNHLKFHPLTPASNCLRLTPDFLAFF